ncbi:hypothetical protein [Anaerosporobacter faecicola]|uniref:hypothetical protein n=1 Tax=Anaerosporobacter faecicola TaxID=2718714 RepID=UPI00143A39EF|nr:hypothetical protein [Anaerosporobacter faecicola]
MDNFDGTGFEQDNFRGGNRPPQGGRDTMRIRNAVIEDIQRERDVTFVTVVYRDERRDNWDGRGRDNRGQRPVETLRLVVSPQTRIFDINRREIRVGRLEEGMVIDAIISSAMTRSIPPQARAFEIFVVEQPRRRQVTEGRILQVNPRNQFITIVQGNNWSSTMRFAITPDTDIFGLNGRRISLRELFPGLRVRVVHGNWASTGFPPQAVAFEIRVLR